MSQSTLKPRLAAKCLFIVGAVCLYQFWVHRAPAASSLTEHMARVDKVILVSEREGSASGAAVGTPSFSPFSAHDWVELDVSSDHEDAPKQWRFDITGANDKLLDSDKMGELRGQTVIARVTSDSYARGYDLKTASGEVISTYEDIADFQNRGAMVFLAGSVLAWLVGAILWFVGKPKTV